MTGRRVVLPALVVLAVAQAGAAGALDVFTLWRQPEVPLRLERGAWVEYKSTSLAGGRRGEDLLRIQCVAGPDDRGARGAWVIEVVPLEEVGTARRAISGEGVQLRLSPAVLERQGSLLDAVASVKRWEGGAVTALGAEEWRQDPLVAETFGREFRADAVERQAPAVRVIGRRELSCEQFVFRKEGRQSVKLPAGELIQTSSEEVTAAVHPDIPFLGVAYAAERVRSESRLEPPSARFSPPPPQASVETLECFGFGSGARPWLQALD